MKGNVLMKSAYMALAKSIGYPTEGDRFGVRNAIFGNK